MTHIRCAALAAALLCIAAEGAFAHVTLETEKAPPNSTYKAVLRVGHGCEGKPTTAIRVKIPEGVIAVKPMPKPGWQLATTKGKYAKTYDYYGTPMAEGVTEVAWTGGELPDEWYDEFVFRGRLDRLRARNGRVLPGRAGMHRRGGAPLDRDPGSGQERGRLRGAGPGGDDRR